jgi:putative ATP-binding cassette transporter
MWFLSMQSTSFINQKPNDFHQFWQNIKVILETYWYPKNVGGRAFSDVIRSWGMLILLVLLIIAHIKW